MCRMWPCEKATFATVSACDARVALLQGYVDSVLFRDVNDEFLQVCADVSGPATLEREFRAFEAASANYPRAKQTMLVLSRDSILGVSRPEVSMKPVYGWLLDT